MGNHLDRLLRNHSNIQAQIIPHRTAFSTSINYSLTPLKFIWTIRKTPAASSTSQNNWWKMREKGLQITVVKPA